MGIFKILRKSIVFSTRSRRRFFPFVVVFGILSLATIMLLFNFENFSREGLLVHRGIVVEVSTLGSVDYFDAQNTVGTINDIPGAEAIIYYRYVDFGANLRICTINTRYQWAFSEIKPNDLLSGSFPSNDMEALVSDELLLTLFDQQGTVRIFTKPVVGARFKIGESNATQFELKVSGIFDKPSSPSKLASGREWIFIPEKSFEILVGGENLDYDDNQIYIHSVSIIASGDVFSGGAYNNVDRIAASLNLNPNYETPSFTSKIDKDAQRNMLVLSLVFGLFGTFMVSTLYSYLITRFRRREVAVLKAMGYNNWDVRIVVLSEILVVALTGYFLGLIAIQAYLWLTSPGTYFFQFVTISANFPFIIPSVTAILSFLAVVISCIPGFFIITFKILGVRPIEIFRQK